MTKRSERGMRTSEKKDLLCGSAKDDSPMVSAQAEKNFNLFAGDFRNRLKVTADTTEPNIPNTFPFAKKRKI
jgi:hypothetical protein